MAHELSNCECAKAVAWLFFDMNALSKEWLLHGAVRRPDEDEAEEYKRRGVDRALSSVKDRMKEFENGGCELKHQRDWDEAKRILKDISYYDQALERVDDLDRAIDGITDNIADSLWDMCG